MVKVNLKLILLSLLLTPLIFALLAYISPCYFAPDFGLTGSWSICRDDAYDLLFGRFVYDTFPKLWGIFGYTLRAKWNVTAIVLLSMVSFIVSIALVFTTKQILRAKPRER